MQHQHSTLKNRFYPLTLLIPGLLIYFCIFMIPVGMSIYFSFTYWDFQTARYAGLTNYINFFTSPDLAIAFKNTFIFTIVSTVFQCLLGLLLAVSLNRKFILGHFYRSVFFLPVVINTIAVGIVFTAMLHPDHGLLNVFLRMVGLNTIAENWLTDPRLAIYTVSFISVWKGAGFSMIIFLAGLQGISKDYYEAAEIDGANFWNKFKFITFPLLMPALNITIVLNLIGGLKVFDIIVATTNGGPGNATRVFNTIIFQSFGSNLQGEASAGNTILGVFVMVVSLVVYRQIRKREVEL